MQRFFVDAELLEHPIIKLPERIAYQLEHVLRARQGDHILLLDNSGWEYQAELLTVSRYQVSARIISKDKALDEQGYRISLFQALVRETKMDWVLQKGTELGVDVFVPVVSEHSLAKPPETGKYERWRRIITEAAEQSGRSRLPQITTSQPFTRACLNATGLRLIATPHHALSLKQILPSNPPLEIAIFIGPEGGFSATEEAYATDNGLLPFRLGKHILRTETAGLAATAAINYHYDT